VDKYFRMHGPNLEKRLYEQKRGFEWMNSRQKEQLSLESKDRGLERIPTHMLLTAIVALRIGRLEKPRSITMLAK